MLADVAARRNVVTCGRKQRRLAGRTRRTLNAIAHLATRASKGKKARLSAECASAIGGAASTVRGTLAP